MSPKQESTSRRPLALRPQAFSWRAEVEHTAKEFRDRLPEWADLWQVALRSAHAVARVPFASWSAWQADLLSVGAAATCSALRVYNPNCGTTLEAFVQLSMQNALRHFLRKEQKFAARHAGDQGALDSAPAHDGKMTTHAVARLLGELTDGERMLARQLFLERKTQAMIAAECGRSQAWVSNEKARLKKKLQRIAKNMGGGVEKN